LAAPPPVAALEMAQNETAVALLAKERAVLQHQSLAASRAAAQHQQTQVSVTSSAS
jgi:hypothetical protein